MEKNKRRYDNSLRLQQQEMTSTAIMVALRDLILEGRMHNFTIQEVADRAGVSHGSVYRHYASREAILEAFRGWCLEQDYHQHVPTYVDTLEELPGWVERMIPQIYDTLPYSKALFAILYALPNPQKHIRTRERDEWILRLVQKTAPNLPNDAQLASYSVIRLLVSMSTWIELHGRYGLDEHGLIAAVNAGISAQIAFLKATEREAQSH